MRRALTATLVLALLTSGCGAPRACAPVRGGESDSVMQLRRLSFGDDVLSLHFVLRPGSAYGIPAHELSQDGGALRIRVAGARLRNPDGTPSFFGALAPSPPPGALRGVAVREDADGSVVIEVTTGSAACALVHSRLYGLGSTFSAALVSIALRAGPVVALDPAHAAPGASVQVVGMGFRPSATATFHIGARTVWSSVTDEEGLLDTSVSVPAASGRGAVLVRQGLAAALAWVEVDER